MGVPAVFGRKVFPLSDLDKIKVIDKLEVADSESDFGLHKNTLVSEVLLFIRIKVTYNLLFLQIRLTYIFN